MIFEGPVQTKSLYILHYFCAMDLFDNFGPHWIFSFMTDLKQFDAYKLYWGHVKKLNSIKGNKKDYKYH